MSEQTQTKPTGIKTIDFALGQLVATPGAIALFNRMGENAYQLLQRHLCGDWGDISPEDAVENEEAVLNGNRILSSYTLGDARIWIITEADRSATTLLLPEEY